MPPGMENQDFCMEEEEEARGQVGEEAGLAAEQLLDTIPTNQQFEIRPVEVHFLGGDGPVAVAHGYH